MHLVATSRARKVERFELMTLDGRIYQYPAPTWLDRTIAWLASVAEPAVISAVVLGLVYVAGTIAESLETLASDTCKI